MESTTPKPVRITGHSTMVESGAGRQEDHRHELRLMARRNGLDEAQLRGMRDVTPAWSTATGQPIAPPPVNPTVPKLPDWYASSLR